MESSYFCLISRQTLRGVQRAYHARDGERKLSRTLHVRMLVVISVQALLGDPQLNQPFSQDLCLTTEARVHADVERLVEDVFFVFFGRREQFRTRLDIDVASRTGAHAAACIT